ncbi:MAG TPA: methyltransferase domain-containing protein [Thermomicrobiales bacterium]|jgi:SAM-dependent methyltransferase|nr:methyltransferase domain-containing protein [Thermomicrobiales bacterium]
MTRAARWFDRLGKLLPAPMPRDGRDELLDGGEHDPAELAANFRDIERVNALLGGTRTVLRHLSPLLGEVPAGQPARILDLATGSADIPLAIVRRARRDGQPVQVVASDIDEKILALARAATDGVPEITVARYDARSVPEPDGAFDVVVCSLALHHLAPDDAVAVLREMQRLSRSGFILNDLRRGRLGYAAAWVASRATSRNRLTRNDAPLSVRRAYTVPELRELLRRAGVDDSSATISRHPWFRMAAVGRGSGMTTGTTDGLD